MTDGLKMTHKTAKAGKYKGRYAEAWEAQRKQRMTASAHRGWETRRKQVNVSPPTEEPDHAND